MLKLLIPIYVGIKFTEIFVNKVKKPQLYGNCLIVW